MCVIITGIKKKPTLVELLAAELQNPDGGGLAWTTSKGVRFLKGVSAKDIHEQLQKLPKSARWVAHFRYATVGEPQVGLCHPFPIQRDTSLDAEGTVDRVLFHNGTVPDWKQKLKDITLDPAISSEVPAGEWSDSRGVAWLLALNESTRPLNFIEGKFVVMNKRGIKIYPQDCTGWNQKDGVMYSNSYWRRRIPQAIASLDSTDRKKTLASLDGMKGHRYGKSLVDEALELLEDDSAENAAMDLAAPKKKKKASKAKPKVARKNLRIRQAK
jgi:hypothetical protein|tara:strand:+ start:4011 stop:4823 length:813 start_codon:yes stop_codon:yes gene_type:complete